VEIKEGTMQEKSIQKPESNTDQPVFQIKCSFTGKILFELQCASLKICAETAVKLGIDLSDADFTDADFTYADFTDANFTYAKCTDADFTYADFTNADFTDARIDFSSWPIWCGSVKAIVCDKIAKQLMYHALAVAIRHIPDGLMPPGLIDWVNESHIVKNRWVAPIPGGQNGSIK